MVSNIILKAATKGIHLYLKDGNLAYKAPEGALTKEFKELIIENKTQIIASLKLQELETSFEYAQLKPVSRNESLPLSFAQQRLWLLDQIDGGSAHYNMPAALKLTGTLNEDALQQAITTILLRHESLRTYFVAGDDGEPIQLIRELDSFEVALTDLSALSQQALQTRIAEAVSTEAGKRFDLTRDLMLRAQLLKISAKEHILLVTMHHIASDGWSQEILVNEFSRLYTAYAQGQDNPLPPLAIQYGDYAHWQRNYLQGAVLNEQLAYWEKQLADLPVLHSLPLDNPRPAVQSFAGNLHVSRIEQATHQRLMAMCQERGATLFMGLHAVFSVLLARYSNEQDIVVGTPVANREQVEVAGLIGFFVNTLVLRSNLSDNPSFHALLEQSKNMLLDAYAHQQVPFEQIVERLQPERSLSHSPLFQVMIALQNNETGHLSLPGLELSEVQKQGPGIAQFDLTLNISEAADGLILAWEYNTDLFEAQTIERMAGHFEVLLSSLLTSPELDVYAHELVTPQEREQLLDTWNDTAAKYRSELCLHELFERQVDTHPKKTALICEETSLSYETLNRRANQLAHYLKAQGVKPDTLVGLSVERSVDMVIAILAILKAGGAYVPLDPSYPQTRLRHMLSDSGVTLVLTQHSVREQLPDCCGQVLCLDDGALQEALTKMAADNLPVSSLGLAPRHLAYVIYTSGSTGQPKGIMVQHQAMLVRQDGWNRVFDLEKRPPVVLQMAGLSVDILLGDMMKALGCGGRLEICPKEVLLSPDKLYQMIQSREITYGDFVPAVIRALTDHLLESGQKLDAMAYISVGCEAWYGRDLRRLKRVIGENTECFNLYGQTESVIDASYCRATELVLADVDTVPVGQPLANTGLYVLNEQQQLQPYGVAGELCVGGKGLALGYAGRAGLTAEKFLAHPFTEEVGQGLYRTGDQAVRRADGSLHFVGRDDEQVKIRGFRVEVKEVEGRLLALEAVKAALVLARQDEGQHKRLVGYLLFEPGQSCSLAALAEHMRAGLPDYMVPSAFVVLESFPLTANGTVDRKALPAPEGDVLGGEYIAPRTETEKTLCRIWQEVLGLERVGISDNFFDLGGHSLLVTKLVARIGEAFEVTLALRKVFEQPRLMDLAALLSSEHSGGMRPPLTAVSREQALPLSFAQQRLWLLDKIDGGSVHYNMPAALRLTGSLNSQALQQAFSTIVGRHESLRTCFVVGDDGEPVQVINTPQAFEVPLTDLSVLPETEQQTQIDEAVAKEAAAAFELSRDLMLRARLLKVAEQEHILLVTMHHIASDGWSMGILVNEFSSLYTAYAKGQENPLAPLAIQYGDYAYWQRNWLQGAVLDEQLGYWEKQLAGLPVVHALPLDHARPAVQSFAGAFHITHINKSTYKALTGLCQAQGATLFMGLHAAFSVLLSRYSNEQDIVIGTPVANREQVEVAGLIGFFVNTLVLRSDLSGKPSFQALLEQSKNMLLDGYAHQQVPFEQIVERLQPERSLSHSPLFQVMLALQNNDDGQLSLPDLNLSIVEAREGESAKYDLTLNVVESEDGLGLGWGYNTALFERDTIARMAEHFEVLLSALVQAPEQDVFSHELATAQEREQLLGRWNNTEAEVPLEYCLHELFAEQADRFPKKTALVCDGISLSYGELNRRANQLAHYLKAQGVKAQTLVGLCVERSVDMVVGILGILKAGGAYVPLDPAYPQARLTYMLRDSGVKLVLSQSWLTLPQEQAVETLYLDKEDIFAEQAQDNPEIIGDVGPKSAVYMIYTSGSTGRPKGVVIEQRNLLNFRQVFEHQLEQLDAQKSNWLWHGSFAFDASVKGILALCSGNTLVVASEREALEPSQLLALTAQHDIQVLNLTPALVPVMLDCLEQGDRGHLHLMIGGEALGKALWDRVAAYGARHDRQALNLYGPTETTINASYAVIDGEVMPHIGKPVANTQFYVMDSRQQLVPTGVVGELYIGGAGVARGYLNRDELTAEKFVANPYFDAKDSNSCRRLYRSGDLVRWRADGELEFIGRIDHQVKVRGLRIELGEIEQCLVEDAGVREAAVLAREAGNNDNRLVAYLVPGESLTDESAFIEAVREQLRKALPDYMVPAAFVVLEALPLTVNGKLNRHALPEPDLDKFTAEYSAPQTETEKTLALIWQRLLGIASVGLGDNFFDLGGHSLLAIKLAARCSEAFEVTLPLREIFNQPKLAALAAFIDSCDRGLQGPPLLPVSREQALPLSYAQQRLWLLDKIDGGSTHYNMPAALKLTGTLNQDALKQAFSAIVVRHESLRTCFIGGDDGEPIQVLQEADTFDIPFTDLSTLTTGIREAEIAEVIAKEAVSAFDLSQDLMLRTRLLKVSDLEHILLVTMHHIASDGWSMGILVNEFSQLYRAYVHGEEASLAPLAIQYGDYAYWQRQWLQGDVLEQQLDYWQNQLSYLPVVHSLPLDYARPMVQSFTGDVHASSLDKNDVARLTALCQSHGATLFMGLHAAFSVLLSRYSNEQDIVVGTPVANREQSEIAELIGFFVNTLVLRSDLSGSPSFHDLLGQSKRCLLDAYDHQQVPFEQIVDRLQPERSLSHSPLFQVMLSLQNNDQGSLSLPGLELSMVEGGGQTAKFDLTLNMAEEAGGLGLYWEFNTAVFKDETIVRMAEHFEVLLSALLQSPERDVFSHELVTSREREQLLESSQDIECLTPSRSCLHELFEEQAARHPEKIALVYEASRLSYGELNRRANQLARYLTAQGVKPDTLVGLCVERSLETVVGMLAILKAGGAYVPLDPANPQSRLTYMLEDSGVQTVLTSQAVLAQLPVLADKALCLDDEAVQAQLSDMSVQNLSVSSLGLASHHLAYVIYTSGSTGQPKGVLVQHNNVTRLLGTSQAHFDFSEADVWTLFHSYAFDFSVWEIWGALAYGGRLVIVPYWVSRSSGDFYQLLVQEKVTVLNQTPSAFNLLIAEDSRRDEPLALRYVVFGGEALNFTQLKPWVARHGDNTPELVNMYGITETTVHVTYRRIREQDLTQGRGASLIGKPLADLDILLLNEKQVLVPDGIGGEMYVSGHGVSRGYLNREELSAERFVCLPGQGVKRFYRTGDLARRQEGGELEYLGRIDHQVKVRGFRIELGEIEHALATHSDIQKALVLARDNGENNSQLVAYLVVDDSERETGALIEDVKGHIRQALPEYMVPSAYMILEALPLTANGKVNVKALPEPDIGLSRAEYVAPKSDTERALCSIWQQVLEVERVGIMDNFFELGGNSLLFVKLLTAIEQEFEIKLAVSHVFMLDNLKSLALHLDAVAGNANCDEQEQDLDFFEI